MKRNTQFKYPTWVVNTKFGKIQIQARDHEEAIPLALKELAPHYKIRAYEEEPTNSRYCPVDDVIYTYYTVLMDPLEGMWVGEYDEFVINQHYEDYEEEGF